MTLNRTSWGNNSFTDREKGNTIGVEEMRVISEGLKSNTTLTSMDLRSFVFVWGRKKKKTSTQWKVISKRLEAEKARALSEALKINSTLTELDLTCEGLGDGRGNWRKKKQKGELEVNGIGDGECGIIVEALNTNSALTSLDLSCVGKKKKVINC